MLKGLQEEGYAVDVADDEKGLWLHKGIDYDLFVADLVLLKLDGFEFVCHICQHDA